MHSLKLVCLILFLCWWWVVDLPMISSWRTVVCFCVGEFLQQCRCKVVFFYWFKLLLRSVFTRAHEETSHLNPNQLRSLYIFENHNISSCNWKNYLRKPLKSWKLLDCVGFNIWRLFRRLWVPLDTCKISAFDIVVAAWLC